MKKMITVFAIGAVVALSGCDSGTPGGPGTAMPESNKPMMGQTDNTFTLTVPMMATSVEQGERETIAIGIKRGTNFAQDVSLKFDNVPPGIHIGPEVPMLDRTQEEVELSVHAADDAAIGDFIVQVTGHPETGADATAELSIRVTMREMEPAARIETDAAEIEVGAEKIESDAARLDREKLIAQMRADLDVLQAKYQDLKARAADATGNAKVTLDKSVAAAKVKLDEAEAALKEAKDAAPDRWEKIKEGFKGAADELKSMFE